MTWFRVDDVLTFHPRVLEAGNAAIGLWVRAGAWSMSHLTDGFIPRQIARQIGSAAEVKRLVAAGLWHEVEGGYQFHAWATNGDGTPRQPTREQVEAKRRKDRERKSALGKNGADAHWNPPATAADSARNPDGIRAASDSPVPSRPVPIGTDTHVSPVPETAPTDVTDDLARRASTFGLDPAVIRHEIAATFGTVPTDDAVMAVATTILGRAKQPPSKPTRYVVTGIHNQEDQFELSRLVHDQAS